MIRFQVDITTGPITQTPSDTCSTVSDRYTTGQLDHYSKTLPITLVISVWFLKQVIQHKHVSKI